MTTRTLQKNQWQAYFDFVSKSLSGKTVDIQILSREMGAQQEGRVWRMMGVSYDPRDDILEIAADNLDHIIESPTAIHVEEQGSLLKSLEVTQRNGVHHVITIMEPLALPFFEPGYSQSR